jgi:ribosomal protein S18 acetylase RimI-like enzyme
MVNDDIRVRLARLDDLQVIRDIEGSAGKLFLESEFPFIAEDEPMSIETLGEHQSQGQLRVAVDSNDKPIGFVVTRIVDGLLHLHELSIHPSHGRKGVGKRLILTVCELAKEQGKSAVTLSTFRDVPWNAPYYQRLGFRILADAELSDGLRQVRIEEAENGLPVESRVCMRKAI